MVEKERRADIHALIAQRRSALDKQGTGLGAWRLALWGLLATLALSLVVAAFYLT
jgi:hypothetical protein